MRGLPPALAEHLLRLLLSPSDRETLSGDLLELYRDRLDRGTTRRRADAWYVYQVARLAWFESRLWIILSALAMLTRTALDWRAPVDDFGVRSAWTTGVSVVLMLLAGMSATWRTHSVVSGGIAAMIAMAAGGAIHAVGLGMLLALWHDATTLAAIHASGGLSEAVTLPAMLAIPAALLGALGGVAARLVRRTDAELDG